MPPANSPHRSPSSTSLILPAEAAEAADDVAPQNGIIRPGMLFPIAAILGFVLGTMMWADWPNAITGTVEPSGRASAHVAAGPTTSISARPITALPRPPAVPLPDDLVGQPANQVAAELRALGLEHQQWQVCSGSVGPGEVRQIVDERSVVLADLNGVSDAGAAVPPGTRVTIKVGNGRSCG